MTRSTLARALGAVAFLTVVSKILGFLREASLAAVFGATSDTDAYVVAQTIPYLLFTTVSYALTTTFIPVYSQIREEQGNEASSRFASTAIWTVLSVGAVLVVFGEALARPLVMLVAPGFDRATAELTTYLSRIILPMVAFQLLSGLLTGLLQADGQFSISTAASLLQNVSIIISVVAFGPRYGIAAAAAGTLVGAMLSVLAKIPGLRLTSFRWTGAFERNNPGVKRLGILMLPAIVGGGVGELNILVDRILASRLPEGSVSALNYANRLMQLAPSIIGMSLVTVIYPTLATMAARNDRRGLSKNLANALGLVHFMLIPIAVGVLVLREPLVRIVFERGMFDADATQETAWALLFLSFGIAIFTMRNLVNRAFFALQDTTTPMILGAIAVCVNIVLNLLLVGPLRQGGLALATTISGFVGLVAGLFAFRRRSAVGFPARRLLSTVVRTGLSSIVMGVVVWAAYPRIRSVLSWHGSFLELIPVGTVVALGAAVYLLMAWVLRVPELALVLDIAGRGYRGLHARLIGATKDGGSSR